MKLTFNKFILLLSLSTAILGLSLYSLPSKAAEDSLDNTLVKLTQALKQSDTDPLVLDVPEVFDYAIADAWTDIQNKMLTTTAKNIVLNISGFGGYTNLGNKFTRAIQASQALGKKVTMVIVGPSYSLHAFITCYADKIVILPGAALMFHTPYTISTHLFGMITYRDTTLDPASEASYLTTLELCQAKTILSKEDIANISDGKDVTIANVDNTIVKVVSPDDLSLASTISNIAVVILYAASFLVLVGLIKRI